MAKKQKQARFPRSVRNLESRAASIASRHVQPEHVDGAIRSLARGLQRSFPNEAELAKVDPNEIDDDTLNAHMSQHAARHPRRAVPPVATADVNDPLTGRSVTMAYDTSVGRLRDAGRRSLASAQDARQHEITAALGSTNRK